MGSKKIKRNRKQPGKISLISSGRSCISSSSNIARDLKMRIPKRNPKHDDAFLKKQDLTQILISAHLLQLRLHQHNPIQQDHPCRNQIPQLDK